MNAVISAHPTFPAKFVIIIIIIIIIIGSCAHASNQVAIVVLVFLYDVVHSIHSVGVARQLWSAHVFLCSRGLVRSSRRRSHGGTPIPWRGRSRGANFVTTLSLRLEIGRRAVKQTVMLKNAAFWDVTLCGCCKNRRFGGTCRLHHQGKKNHVGGNIVCRVASYC
jgi:hypothetical protein